MVEVALVETEAAIQRCFPVMAQLHPNIIEDEFVAKIVGFGSNGYQLLSLSENDEVKAVAGFHLGESFGWGRYLYVDDLVTNEACRSCGYGQRLLDWLKDYGRQRGCEQLHLDSRVIRYAAHKFYLNQGFIIGGYHFNQAL